MRSWKLSVSHDPWGYLRLPVGGEVLSRELRGLRVEASGWRHGCWTKCPQSGPSCELKWLRQRGWDIYIKGKVTMMTSFGKAFVNAWEPKKISYNYQLIKVMLCHNDVCTLWHRIFVLVKPIGVQFTEIMQFDVFLTSGSRPSKLTCKISSAHYRLIVIFVCIPWNSSVLCRIGSRKLLTHRYPEGTRGLYWT